MTTREEITAFLSQNRIAFAGASRDSRKFSNKVYLALKLAGHQVYPINPNAQLIEGGACFPNLKSLPEPVSALMIIASPKVASQVLKDAIECGIASVWVQPGPGKSAELEAEVARARESGMTVIHGLCPMMFMEPVGFPHSMHRFFMRLFGSYPK